MSSDAIFSVEVHVADGVLRVNVAGELDVLTEPELVRAFAAGLEGSPAVAAVLDVTEVGFIDSSGLRALLQCRDAAAAQTTAFSLVVADGPVDRLLAVAGVRDWFSYA